MLATMYPPQDKVSHVIFDLDGLLINSENFYEAADKVVLQALGKAYSVDLEWKLRGRTDLDCAKMIVDYYRLDMTPEEWHTLGTSIYYVGTRGYPFIIMGRTQAGGFVKLLHWRLANLARTFLRKSKNIQCGVCTFQKNRRKA